ncbi:MAG: phosphoribosylformimino-5-aminoimidazole carboxamide ribotide isomerase [Verrucomicrobiota bacterium]
MTRFRPCIDLHEGKVKQIVGGTLRDGSEAPETNFVSEQAAADFAQRYRADDLRGGHLIQLGPGNHEAAVAALAAWPGGLQLGGGVTRENAGAWLEAGAEKVIVTSWLFSPEGSFLPERLESISQEVGRERLVVDLSCRRVEGGWRVAKDRWQTLTDLPVNGSVLRELASACSEFLVHAADVEGRCQGVEEDLVAQLGEWCEGPVTYAGGARSLEDLRRVEELSGGRVDLTIGSALDLFGGSGARYLDCLAWNRRSPQS